MSNWKAYINTFPPIRPPVYLHVTGTIEVSNPGVSAVLERDADDPKNPTHLNLVVTYIQADGVWTSVISNFEIDQKIEITRSDLGKRKLFIRDNNSVSEVEIKRIS